MHTKRKGVRDSNSPQSMKRKSVSSLKKEADRVFSLWIRARDGRCVTCGSMYKLQAGHYVSRSWSSLRYDEKNVNCQCLSCNVFKRGNMDEYARFMIRNYGPDILNELALKKFPYQFRISELEEIIKKYS